MPGIVRIRDVHFGHASPTPNPFHKTAYVGGSPDVFANNRNVIRAEGTDKTACGDPAQVGSPNVYVNGKKVHRKGDGTAGHGSWIPNSAASGSTNVYVNERPSQEELTDLATVEPFVFFGGPYTDPPNGYTPTIIPRHTDGEMPLNAEGIDPGDVPPSVCVITEEGIRNPYEVAYEAWGGNDERWHEIAGSGANPLITALFDELGYNGSAYADATAWCAVFMGAILKRSGLTYLVTMQARNYEGYGTKVEGATIHDQLNNAVLGDIVTFYRQGEASGKGHVGFYVSHTATHVSILGGNQSDTLKVSQYSIGTYVEDSTSGSAVTDVRRAVDCAELTETPPTTNPHADGPALPVATSDDGRFD